MSECEDIGTLAKKLVTAFRKMDRNQGGWDEARNTADRIDELDPPAPEPTLPYKMERTSSGHPWKWCWRIATTVTDDRVATCWDEYNAKLVTDALNRLLHADADELRQKLTQQQSQIRELQRDVLGRLGEVKRLQVVRDELRERVRELEAAIPDSIREGKIIKRPTVAGLLADFIQWCDDEMPSGRESLYQINGADRVAVEPELLEDFHSRLARVRAAEAERSPKPMKSYTDDYEVLSNHLDIYRASLDPKVGVDERELADALDAMFQIAKEKLADLAKVSDPQPGVTREQAEQIVKLIAQVIVNDGRPFSDAAEVLLRELGTAPEPVVTAEMLATWMGAVSIHCQQTLSEMRDARDKLRRREGDA